MPRSDFDVITGPPAPIRPIPPASLPPAPAPVPAAPPERPSGQSRSDTSKARAP
jgi:hypothetical protein